jgi:hypothetical protein
MLDACQKLLGTHLPEKAIMQLRLPINCGGLGVYAAQDAAAAADLVGQAIFELHGRQTLSIPSCIIPADPWFPEKSLQEVCSHLPAQCPAPRLWLTDKKIPPELFPNAFKLQWWMEKIHGHQRELLDGKVVNRDILRLQCQQKPYMGAWLQAIPSQPLGTELSSAIFRQLVKWWLGIPLCSTPDDTTLPRCLFFLLWPL